MKSRRVVVTLEIETDAPLHCLRSRGSWFVTFGKHGNGSGFNLEVAQVQVNVIKAKAARKTKPVRK